MSAWQDLVRQVASLAARLLPSSVKTRIYQNRSLAKRIRATLNKALPQGITEVTIAAGALQGYHFFLNLQIKKDYWLGTYEPELQQVISEVIKPGMVVYDVGANLGYISLMCAKQVGATGSVYAFEALPQNVDLLARNVAANTLQEVVHPVAVAVTEACGEAVFLVHDSSGMGKVLGSAGREEAYQSRITVPTVSLDYFTYDQGNPLPEVIKMDIEGGEVMALQGMRRMLDEQHPLILLELHGPEAAKTLEAEVMQRGYRVCRMGVEEKAITSIAELGWKEYLIARYA